MRNKKIYHEDENNVNKNNRKRKKITDMCFEQNFQEQAFLSERNNELIKERQFKSIIINNDLNPIYSLKKPNKNHKNVINNTTLFEEEKYSIQSGKNPRRRGSKNNIIQNNNMEIEIENHRTIYDNKRNNKKYNLPELNYIDLKNNLKDSIQTKNKNKTAKSHKPKRRKGKKSKNDKIINNELTSLNNEIPIENQNRRLTRSCVIRIQKEKEENVFKQEMVDVEDTKHNKNKGKKGKGKRKEKANNTDKMNNKKNTRNRKSNYIKDRKEKDQEIKSKEIAKKKDYSSPRNYLKNNIINNKYALDIGINEETSNLKYFSPRKKLNNEFLINNKILDDFIYSFSGVDKEKSIIILNKIHTNSPLIDNNKKDLFKVNKPTELLSRKRKRNQPKKEIKEENIINDLPNKKRKNNKKDIKAKNNPKGKSHKFPIMTEKNEDINSPQEVDILKNGLNCDRNKSVRVKGKKGTRKHRSLKKQEKKFEKIGEEINSVDSYSEPEKDFDKNDYFNHKINYNIKAANPNNLSNDQFQSENIQNNNSPKNNYQSNVPFKNDNNLNNNNINNNNTNINNHIKSVYWNNNEVSNNICLNSNLSSNSIKDFASETANFIETSNNYEYSFPIDFEEKMDIKEDKTYFAKNSKYIKYHPIDKYLPPISNEDKKPLNAKIFINRTKKINFSKKKENKAKNNPIDSDNDITDITSSNNDYNIELPSILNIPRIKPFREDHAKKIKEKLNQEGIKLYQTDNEFLLKEERELYLLSFVLYDEKNNIKVTVPCYKDNSKTIEYMNKKKLNIIEFQEDNDIDTDEEQLELEVQRNNNALLNFMSKVKKSKDYVDKNLVRKRKV